MLPRSLLFPRRILVVRSLPGLGDLLCSVPALRALRCAFPATRLSVMGLPELRELGDRLAPWIDEWVDFPGYPGIPEGWQGVTAIPSALAAQQARVYDWVLQLQGDGSYINSFVTLLGGRVTAGCFVPGQYCPDPRYFIPYPETEPEIWRSLRLLEFLQIPLQGDHLEFLLQAADDRAYQALAYQHELRPQSYVCVHPGASRADRCWSASKMAAVAETLAHWGYRVVLTGTAAESALVETVAQQMTIAPVKLVGQTDVGSLALLLRHSALLVCNDTGVSHLAAAMETPSVVIFSNSDPHRWAPLNRDRHRVIDDRDRSTTVPMVLATAKPLLAVSSVSRPEVTHAH